MWVYYLHLMYFIRETFDICGTVHHHSINKNDQHDAAWSIRLYYACNSTLRVSGALCTHHQECIESVHADSGTINVSSTIVPESALKKEAVCSPLSLIPTYLTTESCPVMSCPRQPQYVILWSLFMYLQQNLNTISSARTCQVSVPQTGHYYFLTMLYSSFQQLPPPITCSYDL